MTDEVAPYRSDEEVSEVVRRFESCEFAPDEFKHRLHLTVALLYLLDSPYAEALERMVREFDSLGLKLPYPKGVYRFKTFAEAEAWEWKHMMEAAKKKFRARRNLGT